MGWWKSIQKFLSDIFIGEYNAHDPLPEQIPMTEPIPAPTSPLADAIPKSEPIPMIDRFCSALRDFEGKPGDLNYKNNNPGNVRCSPVGYLSEYGAVKCVNNFSVFPTYELGWKYLKNLVLHRATLHPEWTIHDFFFNYAPPSDNNPSAVYAETIARKCGVAVTTKLKNLFV